MKNFDEFGLKLCRMQAEVFELSASAAKCSSAIFIRRFMNSSVASRMDKNSFLFEACDQNSVLLEIEQEFGATDYGKEKYSREELYWIGYLYRYWCYTFSKTSKQVYKLIKPKELRTLYYPYHSLDPMQAIERILEAKELPEEDYTQKGVAILRKIINKKE